METLPAFQDIDDRTELLLELTERHSDIWRDFLHKFELSWIYHENALEGIVLTHAEIDTALKGRPIAPDTYAAIRNYKRAIQIMRRMAIESPRPIDMEMVNTLHQALSEGDLNQDPEKFRKIIPLHRTYFHDIAQPQLIQPRLTKLLDWARDNDPDEEGAVRFAAHLHHEFMSIFPFQDHTGKVGRLLVNYVLLRHGYMPVLFHAGERQRYYDTLRNNAKRTEGFIIEMMGNCIDNAETYIRSVLEERETKRRVMHVAS